VTDTLPLPADVDPAEGKPDRNGRYKLSTITIE
jgi:hypothetical protein